jgi:hypothetical protein
MNIGIQPVPTHHSISSHATDSQPKQSRKNDVGGRDGVAKALKTIGNYFGHAGDNLFDDSEFKQGDARGYPEIPGEEIRNRVLPQIRFQYNPPRDEDGQITPSIRSPRSRASSFYGGDITSVRGRDRSTTPNASFPISPTPSRPQSPSPSLVVTRRKHSNALPCERSLSRKENSPDPNNDRKTSRRHTLDVPSPVYPTTRNVSPTSQTIPIVAMDFYHNSPAIVVSPDEGAITSPPGRRPALSLRTTDFPTCPEQISPISVASSSNS